MPLIAHHRPEFVPGTPCKLGIDEAGRGAFLGAMVYGCAYWPIEEDAACIAMGFDGAPLRRERVVGPFLSRSLPSRPPPTPRRLEGTHGGTP